MKRKWVFFILVLAECVDMSLKPVGRSCSTGGECRTSYCWNGMCLEPPEDDDREMARAAGLGFAAGFVGGAVVSHAMSSHR